MTTNQSTRSDHVAVSLPNQTSAQPEVGRRRQPPRKWRRGLEIREQDRRRPAGSLGHGCSVDTAAILLVAAGDNPDRIRNEAAWAHLCGVAPLPATSGKVVDRHRLDRGGNRQANHALWRIVFTRMSSDERTQRYVERRSDEGRSRAEIMRMLERYVARETFKYLPRP